MFGCPTTAELMDIDPLSLFTLVTGGTPGTVWCASKVGDPVPASTASQVTSLTEQKLEQAIPLP